MLLILNRKKFPASPVMFVHVAMLKELPVCNVWFCVSCDVNVVTELLNHVICNVPKSVFFIVNVPDLTLFVVSEEYALSVIITLAWTVFPASDEGIVHAKLLLVPVIPVYKAFARRFPVIVLVIK